MGNFVQAVRGMNDILPTESFLWQHLETTFRKTVHGYGYKEIRFPIVEKTELFKRSIGEVTDIVEKEMYTFIDRNEESLSLRPEGTASCVRAAIEHSLLHHQIQKLWYSGPFFRHERPQKGRYRQFHQYSVEVFGLEGPDIDGELISMTACLMEKLGLKDFVTLELNSLGTFSARQTYLKQLTQYFKKHHNQLDEDSKRRLDKNPMRILDSKNKDLAELIHKAPRLLDYLDNESLIHFEKLQDYLNYAGISYQVNPFLVRGLDYYTRTVFEWTTNHLGAQGTICSGGRYDDLVEQLGGQKTPAIGFSLGGERTILLMQQNKHFNKKDLIPHVYLITDSEIAFKAGLKLTNYLHNKVPGLRILLHCGGGTLKNQFKKADKSQAQYAIIIGEHELKTHAISLKNLREDHPQQVLYQDDLAEFLKLKVLKT